MSEDKRQDAGLPEGARPAQRKGRGGARPGAGRKAKWGEKTVVMRVPVSMRGAVEEFLAGKAPAAGQAMQTSEPAAAQAERVSGQGQAGSQPEVVEAQVKQAVADALAAAAVAQQADLAEETARWECERTALRAQLEELRAQLVLAEGQREALAAETERLRRESGPAQVAPGQGSSGPVSAAADGTAACGSAPSEGLAPVAGASAGEPAAAAPAPKPKKPRAPRKKKAQDKAGAVDPSLQMSLFDLLGDD